MNARYRFAIGAGLLAWAFSGCGCAPDESSSSPPAGEERFVVRDSLLRAQVEQLREEADLPGLVVALAEGDGPILVGAAGFADTRQRIPVDAETPFFLGSVSKNLFAAVALQLAEDGALSLEDPVSVYIETPRGDEITVRMLMNHSSGIPEYFASLGLSDGSEGVPDFFSEARPPSEILRLMPSLNPTFEPGSQQSYSNTNFLLLGRVIEEATGQLLGDVFEERIVGPLALKDTYLYDDRTFQRARARGYCGNEGWVPEGQSVADCSFADEALTNSADGSVVSSAVDLLRYHRALRGGEVLSEEAWATMRRVEPGQVNGLGYLIMTGPMGDHEGNAGRSLGHVSANVYYLERELFVVMLLNRGDAALPMRRFFEIRYGMEPQ